MKASSSVALARLTQAEEPLSNKEPEPTALLLLPAVALPVKTPSTVTGPEPLSATTVPAEPALNPQRFVGAGTLVLLPGFSANNV